MEINNLYLFRSWLNISTQGSFIWCTIQVSVGLVFPASIVNVLWPVAMHTCPVQNPVTVISSLCCGRGCLFTWLYLHLEIYEIYGEPILHVSLTAASLVGVSLAHWQQGRSLWRTVSTYLGGTHWGDTREVSLTMSVVITLATIWVIVFPKSLFPFLRLRILGKKGPWTL